MGGSKHSFEYVLLRSRGRCRSSPGVSVGRLLPGRARALADLLTRSPLGARYDAPMFYDFEASESPLGQDRVDDWYVCCVSQGTSKLSRVLTCARVPVGEQV